MWKLQMKIQIYGESILAKKISSLKIRDTYISICAMYFLKVELHKCLKLNSELKKKITNFDKKGQQIISNKKILSCNTYIYILKYKTLLGI